METIKRYKIIFSLIISLGLTLAVTKTIFFAGVPKINAEKIRRTIKNSKDSLTIFKNTFTYKISSKKIDYEKIFADVPAVEYVVPTLIPIQKSANSQPIFISVSPVPTRTLIMPSPTQTLTPYPSPTEIILRISPTIFRRYPTITTGRINPSPTKYVNPTASPKPSPTSIPEPTPKPTTDPLRIDNPLDQPYYNPRLAYKCYNTDKFIEVYAGGVSQASCYEKVQSAVSSNLTSVSILGKSISINKKSYPAFKAVSDALNKNRVAKAYRINTIGAYVFRCNVNASTSDRNDLCSNGCVLSAHSFGIAVDINWDENCNGCSNYTMPMEIVDIFESYGFRWGGRYKSIFGSTIDPMHFEYMYDLCKDTE